MKKTKSNRGGRRKGAGRKPLDNAGPLTITSVALTTENITKARKLGAGTVSIGVRKALDKAEE